MEKAPPSQLEEEALEFVSKRNKDSERPFEDKLLVAVILAGLLARGPSNRAEELLGEARRYYKLLYKFEY